MNTPQILLICCLSINLLDAANKHGKPKEGIHNLAFTLIDAAFIVLILYWGGFFP